MSGGNNNSSRHSFVLFSYKALAICQLFSFRKTRDISSRKKPHYPLLVYLYYEQRHLKVKVNLFLCTPEGIQQWV